jgi:hypothetical protein
MVPTLEERMNEVDWARVSKSSMYTKDEAFIRQFHSNLDWENIYNIVLNPEVAAKLTFDERIIPFTTYISLYSKCANVHKNISENLDYVASKEHNMTAYMNIFGPKQTEDTFQHFTSNIDPHHFAHLCCSHQYIPTSRSFINILKRAYKGGDWVDFMVSCKPSFAFIEEHIVPGASKDAWLHFIEKHTKRRYSLEYQTFQN